MEEKKEKYRVEEDFFPSADQKHRIAYRICTPECNPFGIVQLVHGLCADRSTFAPLEAFLAENGLVVCSADLLGHGKSVSSPEDRGFFAENGGIDFLTKDIDGLRLLLRNRYRFLPYILLGDGFGSLLVRRWMTGFGEEEKADACVLCGTAGSGLISKGDAFLLRLRTLMKKKSGADPGLTERFLGKLNAAFPKEEGKFAFLSEQNGVRDAREREAAFLTLGALSDLVSLLGEVNEEEWASKVPQSLPVFLASGQNDPVGGCGKGVSEVAGRLEDAEINDLSVKLYASSRHDLISGADLSLFFADLLAFARRIAEGVVECRRNGI